MNKSNFNQTGGYPLKTQRLDEMQTAYSVFNSLGFIAGDLSIINGCAQTGNSVQDGVVFINGEVLPFKGGVVMNTVIIIEEATQKEFQSGEVKAVHFKRYATFGTGQSYLWSAFKRSFPTNQIQAALDLKATISTVNTLAAQITELQKKSAVFQAGGGMVLWNKPANQIPLGWAEVLDWRGRLPIGYDPTQTEFTPLGKTGGSKVKTLSVSELPQHAHTGTAAGPYIGNNIGGGFKGGDNDFKERPFTTGTAGSNSAFSIMNPYRVVMFIEYIG